MPIPVPKRADAMPGISRKNESSKMIFRMMYTPIVKEIFSILFRGKSLCFLPFFCTI